MTDRFVLTPYFLDSPLPSLEPVAKADWQTNRPLLPSEGRQQRMLALYRPLARWVAQTVVEGDRPVSVAGDCCTALGVLAGLQQAGLDPTLIWLDAHGDFNTWETTPSGFLGGMPLAMLVGLGEQTLVEGVGLVPASASQVILSDGRELDPGERELLADAAVFHLPDAEALRDYDLPAGPLYVHFDTDVVNPNDAPAMNYRARGGPTAEALHRVFHHLARTERVAAVSMSTWNPELDEEGRSRMVCMDLLQTLLGR